METIKKISDQRANELNKIQFLKNNSIVAVNTQWNIDGTTWAELYSRKTKKRVKITTSMLFNNQLFLDSPETFFQKKEYIKDIITK